MRVTTKEDRNGLRYGGYGDIVTKGHSPREGA